MSVFIVKKVFIPLHNQALIKSLIIFVNHARMELMNVMVILFLQTKVIGMKTLTMI
jgi:hypothetical protein